MTVLVVLVLFIVYAAFGEKIEASTTPKDPYSNVKRGIFAALLVGLVFCAEHLRDTLFIRPHPAVWRLATGVGLFYSLFCVFLLFLSVGEVRALMPHLDPKVTGQRLAERSYGEACALTWANVKGGLDEFVLAHLLGWVFKHCMLRDLGLSMSLSLLFELMEYTFEFLQPNFIECWWDHWLLDFVLCNTGGIIIGEILLRWLNSKSYDWSGTGFRRLAQQFTPYSWTPYRWEMLRSFRRFCLVLAVAVGCMVIELDAFFLKDIFWVQPKSKLNVYRLGIWWAVGMVGLRDYYAFLCDPARVKRLGSTAWVMLAMMILEFLVVLKFARELYKGQGIPPHVAWLWGIALVCFVAWTVWWFALGGMERSDRKRQEQENQRKPRGAGAAAAAANDEEDDSPRSSISSQLEGSASARRNGRAEQQPEEEEEQDEIDDRDDDDEESEEEEEEDNEPPAPLPALKGKKNPLRKGSDTASVASSAISRASSKASKASSKASRASKEVERLISQTIELNSRGASKGNGSSSSSRR